ncbi:phosphoglycerate mutase family protein [Conexibacter stalactiti]|uniref:Phosphoglycerate mutase family protein n=1 Tax=Conexibacter stalactiti TaxID=1940611 RepID=A0ABU4HNE4_9ACTN|nr:phosphoglycerate mutase family protein [Conexibacter stalactiti]MDW5594820.1 phosphoglycerate mutase family protein [Conexibacter stalactiti]MEC5035462.1 phosphoglycerate mutase family protein [Conexibacter stalactiti]
MIWLLRHGDAHDPEPGQSDAERPLTEKGERQARAAGVALARLGVEIDCCLASPRVRARETARLACEALGVEVEIEPVLQGGRFEPEALAAGRGSQVLLVGHEPDFSRAVRELTGAVAQMKKGGLAGCDPGLLHVLLRPAELRAIAGA